MPRCRPLIDLFPARLLGAHVSRRAQNHPHLCTRHHCWRIGCHFVRFARFRQTKIEDFHRPVRPDLDVGRFQIAMHDAFLVRSFESIHNLLPNTECFFERNRAFFNPLSQSRTLDVLHDQVIGADVVQSADVGMIQCRNRPRLTFKPIVELLRRYLNGDIAPELQIARTPHFAHPAFADGRDDFVSAEFVSGLQFHQGR